MLRSIIRRNSLRCLFKGLGRVEKILSKKDYQLKYSPTFVVAPPRAGTTVTRQLVAWAMATSYFSNLTTWSLHHAGYPLPITTARLTKWLNRDKQVGRFESEYGQISGVSSPAEGELIWGHWFRTRHSAVEPEDLTEEQQRVMYQSVAATERAFDRPFFNKTSALGLRIRALIKIFPNALFIQVLREPIDIAQSIYRARNTKYPYWLGPMPRECENSRNKSVLEQVCEQVCYVEKHIAYERSVVGEDKFLPVSYKDLCENPSRELNRIAEFMNTHGAPATIVRTVPRSLEFSHGRKIGEADYLAMKAYLNILYTSHIN